MIPRNAGQTCIHAKRFFVQEGNHDVLIARLTQRKKAERAR
ncbi:aldehyde dehydrogenase family protein [Falsiruegeria mediterranea]